jgi:hypothetical protein
MVLVKMKETAEAYLGHKVTHAVVTVPACKLMRFSDRGQSKLTYRLQRRSASRYQGRWNHRRFDRSPNRQRAHRRRNRYVLSLHQKLVSY